MVALGREVQSGSSMFVLRTDRNWKFFQKKSNRILQSSSRSRLKQSPAVAAIIAA